MKENIRLPVFLHIPSTGGSALSATLESLLPGTLVIRNQTQFDGFWTLSKDKRAQVLGISGHVPHGIHRVLGQECAYATMLRDPIERLPGIFVKHLLSKGFDPASVSLRDYDFSEYPIIDNMLTRRLCTYDWPVTSIHWARRTPLGCVTQEMYEQAVGVLQDCAAIGFYENFDVSTEVILRGLSLPSSPIPRVNVGNYDRSLLDISDADREFLEERNALDIALYECAKKLSTDSPASKIAQPPK